MWVTKHIRIVGIDRSLGLGAIEIAGRVVQTKKEVDAQRVIVFGHSRLGKTSLWAGRPILDFAGVISNDSGAGGAALSKRIFGETVWRLNTSFPSLCMSQLSDNIQRERRRPAVLININYWHSSRHACVARCPVRLKINGLIRAANSVDTGGCPNCMLNWASSKYR